MAAASGAYSYNPHPHEQAYYESLFAAADQARTGQLNGRDAVGFLSRSKLPVDLLKNIWTIADQNPKTNFLDKNKFFVSVRLIQFYQNGQTAQTQNLEADNTIMMRPPYFEGVTGVSAQPFTVAAATNQSAAPPVPAQQPAPSLQPTPTQQTAPPQQQQQQPMPAGANPPQQHSAPPTPQRLMHTGMQQTALAAQDPYGMLPAEQVRYEDLFPQYAANGFVYGKQAVELFSKSGLGKEILRDIWNLVDNPVDNRLSRLEFAIAMHLIICVSKKNLPLPKILPPSLTELKDSEANPPPVTEMQQQPPPASALSPLAPALQPQEHSQNPLSGSFQQRASISNAFDGLSHADSAPVPPSPIPATDPRMQVPAQQNSYLQPVTSEPAQPPPVISISDNNKFTSSMVPGMPSSPALSSLRQNSLVPELPNLLEPPRATNANIGGNGGGDADRVQSVLQRLQAENISLKAQLGQFTEEEQKVQQDIAHTVMEIGNLSQELTSLRSQVVDAKSSLIEATSELKAQIEKRE